MNELKNPGRARGFSAEGIAKIKQAARRARISARARAGVVSKGRPRPDARAMVGAFVHQKDVVFKIKTTGLDAVHREPHLRAANDIHGFSYQSARRLTLLVRNTADLWTGFVTLTYPKKFTNDGRAVKRHINAFCTFLRRKKIAYIWVLEFQKRGAPHFHFLVSGFISKTELSMRWFEIVGSGDPAHLKSGTNVKAVKNPDHVGAYMASYMTKLEDHGHNQKAVPGAYFHVGRFWGASKVLKVAHYKAEGLYADAARAVRRCRKWYESRCKTWGFKWKWRGQGFILIGGAAMFTSLMRQALMADRGESPWNIWDGQPAARDGFLTPEQRLALCGQPLLDGGFVPAYPDELPRRRKAVDAVTEA